MQPHYPSSLLRFRPLSEELFEQLSALADSYLYAPSFSDMNDPMEAFYDPDGSFDFILNSIVPGIASSAHEQLRQTIDKFGLVSFSDAADNLLLWGYYAQGFRGMCLEFDSSTLARLSRFKNEPLLPVTYADSPASPILTGTIIVSSFQEALIHLLCRKRTEWSHEREWRFLAGQVGKRHYVDDALRRIYFGPLAREQHIAGICEVMKRRPVEILKGRVTGYNLSFDTIQSACKFHECDRLSSARVDLDALEIERVEIQSFLEAPVEQLRARCAELADHPNIEGISSVHVTGDNQRRVVICAAFRLRDGLPIYENLYFDSRMNLVTEVHSSNSAK